MTPTLLTSMVALIASATPQPSIAESFEVLSRCQDIKAAQCLNATARLEAQSEAAIRYIAPRFEKMTPLGQMLALSVYGSQPSYSATQALARLVLKAKLAPSIKSVAIQLLADRFDGKRTKRLVSSTLIKAAKDKQATIRGAAIRALGNRAKGADRHILQVLRHAASDSVPSVRREAVLGLGMSARNDVAGLLIDALSDPVLRVRIAAADGLSFVKSERAVEPLIECLRSDEGLLRRVASEALTHQTKLQFGDDYLLWREWYLNR